MGFWKSVGRALAESASAQAARDKQKAARKETAAYLAAIAAAGAETNKGRRKKLFEQALSLKEKADAIYWFSDFAVDVDEVNSSKITEKLQENKVKLILHSFAGKDPKAPVQEMMKKTHGDLILKQL